jgi:hypothetical protein
MLADAHKGLELMCSVCDAVKSECWNDAERKLRELQQIVRELRLEVRERREGRASAKLSEGT